MGSNQSSFSDTDSSQLPSMQNTNASRRAPGGSVTSQVSSTISVLNVTTKYYNIVKDDKCLPEVFHEAGRGLLLAKEALQTIEAQPVQCGLVDPRSVTRSLEACSAKVKLSENLFKHVAEAPESSRLERYRAFVRREGKENMAEVLVKEMMNDICDLAKDGVIEAAMKGQVQRLRKVIENLSDMEPSVPDEQSGHFFSNSGSGNQFNTPGGTQNNNMGNGNQFPGATFGTVHFGSMPA